MNIIKIIYVTIFTVLISSIDCYAQKPRKIFSHIQENNLNLALEEYAKIKSDKVYDTDEKILFEIADCIFLINKSYPKYNPILSIKYFNNIYNNLDNYFNTPKSKKEIHEFLAKYDLTFDTIANRIHSEIVFEAKKINTVESYDKALEVCSDKYRFELKQLKEEAFYKQTINESTIGAYKTFILTYSNSKHVGEIQVLLERKVLDNAKSNQSVDDLNTFIVEYATSNLKQEATDFRDSIVLSKVPNTYDAMLAFTKEYTNSKYVSEIEKKLGDLLYNKIMESKNIEDYQLFKKLYFNHSKLDVVLYKLDKLDSLQFTQSIRPINFELLSKYLTSFPDGKYFNLANNYRDFYYKIKDSIYLTTGEYIQRLYDYADSNSYDYKYFGQYYDVFDFFDISKSNSPTYIKLKDLVQDWDKDGDKDFVYIVIKPTVPNESNNYNHTEYYFAYYLSSTKKLNLVPAIDKYVRIGINWTHNNRKELVLWESCGTGRCLKDYTLVFSNEFQDFRFVRLHGDAWEPGGSDGNGQIIDILNDVKVDYNSKQTKLYLDFPKFLLSDGFSSFSEFAENYFSF